MENVIECIRVDKLNNKFFILNQLLLPHNEVWEEVNTVEDTYKVIEQMKVRGAPLIGVTALQGMRVAIKKFIIENSNKDQLKKFVEESCAYLAKARPTAVNLSGDLNWFKKEYLDEGKNLDEIVEKNYDDYAKSCDDIGEFGADIILRKVLGDEYINSDKKINILTICNTGSLATPGIGTALGIVKKLNHKGFLNKVYIPETRPYLQGSRLTAYESVKENLPGILITDLMTGLLMSRKEIDAVVIGADRVTSKGFTANKIGSYSLAVLSKYHSIPFYVACSESTIDMSIKFDNEIKIEERPGNELKMILGKVSIAPDEIKCYNPGFDVTPPNLIEAIITEKGTFKGLEKQICEWYEITPELIQRYLIDNNLVDEVISVSDIADGNLNNCFKIEGISNNKRVVYCLKQALPYIKCLGKENPLDLKRSFFECEAMKYYNEVAPSNTTKFYFYDPKLFIIVMEFLENNTILRKKMIQRVIYPNIGTKLGNFIANTTFFSSHIHISPKEFRNKINCFNENTLTELTEKVIFSDPYVNDSWNRHTPGLENIINEIRTNKNLIKNIFKLRQYFITEKQALIHADLHIGSIMVHDDDLNCDPKVIDGEFIIVGPIAFDLGKLVGNFVMNYYSQILHPNEKTNEKDYCEYLLNEIRNIFVSFKQEFLKLWSIKENRYNDFPGLFEGNNELFYEVQNDYISSILKNSYYFMAASIIRRIIGVAHNIDFEMENDVSKRVKAETRALKFAYSILSDSVSIVEIDDLIKFIAIN